MLHDEPFFNVFTRQSNPCYPRVNDLKAQVLDNINHMENKEYMIKLIRKKILNKKI